MRGGQHLLLLAAFVVLASCQQPKVSLSPNVIDLGIYPGDSFYFRCENSAAPVKWYFNGELLSETSEVYKIHVAHSRHTGDYQCESSQKSESFHIDVRDYLPHASLTIRTGHPVMQRGASIILHLENEGGLEGWGCMLLKGDKIKTIKLNLNKKENSRSIMFQPNKLDVNETTFWCTDKKNRSNQVTVKTSDKAVSLDVDPMPPINGVKVTLRCLVWGTDEISYAQFYRDNRIIANNSSPVYVTTPEEGTYSCFAKFKRKAQTSGYLHTGTSDYQTIFIQGSPIQAVLSYFSSTGMSCNCSHNKASGTSYSWYLKKGNAWMHVGSGSTMWPTVSGTYACKAKWTEGTSALSNFYTYEYTSSPTSLIIGMLVIVFLILLAVIAFIYYKKRNTQGPIYEDVALRSRDKGDDKYEPLQKAGGAQKEAEYDTLNPEASRKEKKEGEYEPLKKEGVTEGVYHTLATEGAAGGEGGYEALKKEGRKEGEYHTLGTQGAAGGEGGYEALKKEGRKEGEYHTLGTQGAAGGEGGYEALKKEGLKEGEYHTLGTQGAAGGEGGYEALKKEGLKEGVYHSLSTEGAAGGEEAEGKDDKRMDYETVKENEEVEAEKTKF